MDDNAESVEAARKIIEAELSGVATDDIRRFAEHLANFRAALAQNCEYFAASGLFELTLAGLAMHCKISPIVQNLQDKYPELGKRNAEFSLARTLLFVLRCSSTREVPMGPFEIAAIRIVLERMNDGVIGARLDDGQKREANALFELVEKRFAAGE